MQINFEVLKAHNDYDMLMEQSRDIELSVLKENRYKLTDEKFTIQYNTICDKFEKVMFRTWLNKDLIIIY